MKLFAALLLSLLVVPVPANAAVAGCGDDCALSVNDQPVCVVPNPCKVAFKLDKVAARDVVVEYRISDRTATRGRDYDADPTGRVVIAAGTASKTLSIRTLSDTARTTDREFTVVATSVTPGRIARESGLVTIKSTH